MITKGKFRFPSLLVGMGLGAVAGLLLAPGAVEEMWKYLRGRGHLALHKLSRQAGKLRDSAGVRFKQGKEFIGPARDSVKNIEEAERQVYEEQKRENPGG